MTKKQAIADHSQRENIQEAAQDSFNSASAAYNLASDNLANAELKRDNLVTLEKEEKNILDAAVNDRTSKSALFNAASTHKSNTETRVAEEKTALLGVIDELNKVTSSTSVGDVIVAIRGLITAGTKEVEDATEAFNNAKNIKDRAIQVENIARSKHSKTFGALTEAQAEVKKLTPIKAEKLSLKLSAQTILKNANDALKSALAWMNQEVARVASETATLNEVKKLLNDL